MITHQPNSESSGQPTVDPLVALHTRVAARCSGELTIVGDAPAIKVGDDTIAISIRSQAGYRREFPVMHLTCSCAGLNGHEFSIDSGGIIEAVCERLNIGDMNTGFVEFDKAFNLQSANEDFLRAVLNNEAIRMKLFELTPIGVALRGEEATGQARLVVAVGSPTEDDARLASIAELALNIAQQCRRVASASC